MKSERDESPVAALKRMMMRKFNKLEEELKENMQKQFNEYQEKIDKSLRRHRNN
jgi:molybdenum-dependent DNA-binding transcriptional regulator ModE